MRLYIDLETSSKRAIETGTYAYASESRPLLIAWAISDGPAYVFDATKSDIRNCPAIPAMYLADEIWAHHAAFDRLCLAFAGYSAPLRKWRCSKTLALVNNYPASLNGFSNALETANRKQPEGKALVKKFCLQQSGPLPGQEAAWDQFIGYASGDVLSMRDCVREIERRGLIGAEVMAHIWREYEEDQLINDRGAHVDMDALAMTLRDAAAIKQAAKAATRAIGIDSPNCVAQIKAKLAALGVPMADLTAATCEETLARDDLPAEARALLEARELGANSSLAKLPALRAAVVGGRFYHGISYYGAPATGRGAGRVFNYPNLPRPLVSADEINAYLAASAGTWLTSTPSPDLLVSSLRGVLAAAQGNVLISADLAAIEGRILAWHAGAQWKLDLYRQGADLYKISAAAIYSCSPEDIKDDSYERLVGKVAELALGYKGGVKALIAMARGYSVDVSRIDLDLVVHKWRTLNTEIVKHWDLLESRFRHRAGAPHIILILPSGRPLIYHKPRASRNRLSYSRPMGENFYDMPTHCGELTNNQTQGTARDILYAAMSSIVRLAMQEPEPQRAHGIPVMHIYDQLVMEVPAARAAYYTERLRAAMEAQLSWARGLPLKVKITQSHRFGK